MRKLAAFLICGLIALLAGYTFLPTGYNALVDWLGPIFGLPLVFVFSSLYVLFADPFKFTFIAILWAVVGLIGGMIIRKRVGSVATVLSVYSAQLSVLSLAAYGLFDVVRNHGILSNPVNILNLLPPVPQGASLATIMNAPVVSEVYAQIQGLSFTSFNPEIIIDILLNTVVLSVVKNLVILSVAALVGCELGKLTLRPLSPRIEAFRTKHMAVPKTLTRKPLLAALALLVLLSSLGVIVPVRAGSGLYSETILATVTPQGTAIASAVFVDTAQILKGIDLSNPAFENSIGAALIAQKLELSAVTNEVSLLLKQMSISGVNLNEVLRFYERAPSTILVLVYRGDRMSQETAQSQANTAADLFGKKFGTTFTPFIPTGSLPIEDAPVRIFSYQSELTFSGAADKLVGELPETTRGGLARYIGRVYRTGVLTPGKTRFSANGTVLATGFINVEAFGEPDSESGFELPSFLPTLDGKIPFWGLGCFFASRFHSSPIIVHELNIADLFQTTEDLAFSSYSNASSIITFIPTGNTTAPGQASSPITKIVSTLNATQINDIVSLLSSMMSQEGQQLPFNLTASTLPPGVTIDPSTLTLTFTQRFPLQLRVSKTASVSEVERGQVVNITVILINDDSEAAENVQIDDSSWQRFYPAATLVSGTTSANYQYINGSSSAKLSYVIQPKELGTYTLPAAVVLYTYMGDEYIQSSNVLALQVPRPNAINVLSEGAALAWNALVGILNLIPPVGGNGSTILTIIVVGVVALIVFTQYRGYRKWLRVPTPK